MLAGSLHMLWRGLRFGSNAMVILGLALGLLPLMFGVLCDLVLAPFRWRLWPQCCAFHSQHLQGVAYTLYFS